MPARIQELKIGIGFHRQTGTGASGTTKTQLQTALAAIDLWNLGLNAFNAPFPQFKAEDDSDFFGKGDEWVRQVFPTSLGVPWEWPYFLTSQNFAQVIAFALGKTTKTPAGSGFQYVATPMDPVTDGVNLPATTVVAGIRQATAGEMLDMAIIGMVCTGFTFRLTKGSGLQNSSLVSRWSGCGKFSNNSGVTIPARSNEARLGAGSATAININGVDYITNARFVDLEFTYDNGYNPEAGKFPGSGSQSGYDIGGRARFGKRTASLVWTVELEQDSQELSDLTSQVVGSSHIQLVGAAIGGGSFHTADILLPQTIHKEFSMQDSGDGFVAAKVVTAIEFNDSLGPTVLTAITDKDEIGEDA